jgi:hypothetical protein
VDQADAGDHRSVAETDSSRMVAAVGGMIKVGPTEGPEFLHTIPNPVAKRCSMNDRLESPGRVACHCFWECTPGGAVAVDNRAAAGC